MTFDLQRIIESKRAWRRALAQRPVAEKLAMLDALRDRARTIRAAAARLDVSSPTRSGAIGVRESLAGISQQASGGLNMPGKQPQK